ncbi:MAG TPA: hypothetical protein VFH61_17985 [Thermoleophilia bacterium]|nr:hypothetical protein [Thermoleophilia bacterium]
MAHAPATIAFANSIADAGAPTLAYDAWLPQLNNWLRFHGAEAEATHADAMKAVERVCNRLQWAAIDHGDDLNV